MESGRFMESFLRSLKVGCSSVIVLLAAPPIKRMAAAGLPGREPHRDRATSGCGTGKPWTDQTAAGFANESGPENRMKRIILDEGGILP
ncbi:hypothetical protein GCM10027018_21400 [Paenibacillus thermoaerophilus]